MPADTQPVVVSKKLLGTGWIMSVLPALRFLMSAGMKFAKPPPMMAGFKHLELSEQLARPLGIRELAGTVRYLIPRTAVLGAIWLTGYPGGAIGTHLRVGDPFIMPALIGVVIRGGIFFVTRDCGR